jgi:hypothetical protein
VIQYALAILAASSNEVRKRDPTKRSRPTQHDPLVLSSSAVVDHKFYVMRVSGINDSPFLLLTAVTRLGWDPETAHE